MASTFCELSSVGHLIKSPETECELEWKLPDYVSLMETEELHLSPTFSFAGNIWRLFICVCDDYVNAGIIRESTIPQIILEVSVGFKTSNGKKVQEGCATHGIVTNGYERYTKTCCFHKTELLERKSDLLPSNALTVFYTLKYSKASKGTDELPASVSSIVLQENKILNDLKEFFLKKEDCDVVLKVQGEEFQAHKAILQARSPVLASTFRNDMKEKSTGVVEIEDCNPSSFSEFLCFLYCGDVEVISQANVFSLFTTADKYDVQDLRAQCVKYMKDNLSVDRFCDTIALALRHSEAELIKLTTDFFTKNAPKIILTVKWQTFLAENPTESNELLVKLLVPNSSK